MLELFLFILTSFAVGLSGALVPGPMLTVTITDSVKRGSITGPLVILGHFIAEFTLIIFIMAGFSWLVGSTSAAIIIGTLGGLMLIYIGFTTSRSEFELITSDIDNKNNNYGPVLKGVLTSISNPYFFIWWATIGLAFLFKGLEIAGLVGLVGFLVGHWSADLGWYSTVSILSSKGSEFLSKGHYNLLMKICGVFLIALGLYFLFTAQTNMLTTWGLIN